MNPYDVLGLAQNASPEEIKKSYRKLALECHPDHHPDDQEAQERFKTINAAYDILSDPAKKENFDSYGDPNGRPRRPVDPGDFMRNIMENLGGFGFVGQVNRGPTPGQSVNLEIELTLSESILGSRKKIEFGIMDPCHTCDAKGYTKFDACKACGGKGGIAHEVRPGFQTMSLCRKCGGVGEFMLEPCEQCAGEKYVKAYRDLMVNFPGGVHHGNISRIRDKGQRGSGGAPSGDLVVRVLVKYPSNLTEEQKDFFRKLDNPELVVEEVIVPNEPEAQE